MPQQVIGIGATANDGNGDPLRTAMSKVNNNFTELYDLVNGLLYEAPVANLTLTSPSVYEVGSTVTTLSFTWDYGGPAVTNQTLTGATLQPGDRSYTITGLSVTSNATYTLSATDGTTPTSDSVSIQFQRKRYWGESALTTLTTANILALANSEFGTTPNKTATYNCSGGEYPYYCYPTSWGALTNVTVGGLAFSDYTVATQSFTNASGSTTNYYVVRFNGIQTGSNITVTWS